MINPKVSFVIPCYKLAHFLSECVNSILTQTYSNFEILIMDDCSPDNTPEVCSSFSDDRVKHIRNSSNLGHLRNYNKGISLATGKYVWLISADDRLRRPYALERYVLLMESRPEIGYVFCPGVGLRDGKETAVLAEYYYGAEDTIFDGRQFIATVLRRSGGIVSPSVMVRKECYEKISLFPLDMPHQGDLYLWFVWALEHDVAYISEPLVNYRFHDLSMMKDFLHRIPQTVFTDEVNVLWRTKRKAEQIGLHKLGHELEYYISEKYASAVARALYNMRSSPWAMGLKECDDALRANATTVSEYRRLRGQFYASLGDKHWWNGTPSTARHSYTLALWEHWYMPQVWLKLLLCFSGRIGRLARLHIRRVKLQQLPLPDSSSVP